MVIYASQLLSAIYSYHQPIFTPSEVQSIYQHLLTSNRSGKESRKEHVQTIKKDIQAKTLKVAELICPKCDGELVERKGKYGTFLGCSIYPKYRFVQKERKIVGLNSRRTNGG